VSATNWVALMMQRHCYEYGTTREQLGAIAVTLRANAALNPDAIYRDPMTIDDYLAARIISYPLCLYDCDIPADGSVALVLSHRDHASGCPSPAVQIYASGTAVGPRPSWDQRPDMTQMGAWEAGADLWSNTDLKPEDVDTAHLYDGFSPLTLAWIEALGFCGKGEGGMFLEGGARIARDGQLPLNTDGGQLSFARLSAFGHFREAVLQLRGQAGERQVAGSPQVAVVAGGAGPIAGCMLFKRGPA
jgi:acetyl-CoA acetyltransferase